MTKTLSPPSANTSEQKMPSDVEDRFSLIAALKPSQTYNYQGAYTEAMAKFKEHQQDSTIDGSVLISTYDAIRQHYINTKGYVRNNFEGDVGLLVNNAPPNESEDTIKGIVDYIKKESRELAAQVEFIQCSQSFAAHEPTGDMLLKFQSCFDEVFNLEAMDIEEMDKKLIFFSTGIIADGLAPFRDEIAESCQQKVDQKRKLKMQ
jgi:hypothetical protein